MQNLGEFLTYYAREYRERIAYKIKRGLRTQIFRFEDVLLLSLKTATFLKNKGLKKGDKVAIWAPNMPEYPILYFGCWLLGVIAVPIDVRTTEETLRVFLAKARCQLSFKGKFIPGTFRGLIKETYYLEDLVDLASHLKGVHTNISMVVKDDLAEIAFTSGTTGTPKGVMLTHGNFLSDVEALTNVFPFKKDYRALSLLPLSHAFEQVVDFLALFKSGIQVTYLERMNRLTILRAMKKNKITSAVLVPQALQLFVNGIEQQVEKQGKQAVWAKLHRIAPYLPIPARRLLFRQVHQRFGGKLTFFGCGSAPLHLKLAQKWENMGIAIFEGYGATETTAALTINTPSAKKLGSVGKVLPGMEIRINPQVQSYSTDSAELTAEASQVEYVDTSGYEKEGEILAKGSTISPGYFKDKEKTKQAFQSEWYQTGDIGQIDKDGFLYITGREAFRIVLPNGQKVYPEDLEKKLNSHPLVTESCVVGVKREEGERVHAAIITMYPQKLDQIIQEANQHLASHEQILEWSVWQGDDFPRTPMLKIDRIRVREAIEGIPIEKPSVTLTTEDTLKALIAKVANVSPAKIKQSSTLATDLKLDSLKRVELLSLIEQELAVALPETAIHPQTTVSALRKLIDQGEIVTEEIPINEVVYTPWFATIRVMLQNILAFPLHRLFVPIKVYGKEHLKGVHLPAIFYFNHIGILDGLCVLRVLPQAVREKLVIAVAADLWNDYRKPWVELLGGGFPFDKKEKVKASLEVMGEFLDKGYCVLMAPEGTFTEDGRLLEFKPGIGFMAVHMHVPVVPIKIDTSYREIFPPMEGSFRENIPKKRKEIWIKIGKPLTFARNTSYEGAAYQMRHALDSL